MLILSVSDWCRFYDIWYVIIYMLHDTLDTPASASASYVLATASQKIFGLINKPAALFISITDFYPRFFVCTSSEPSFFSRKKIVFKIWSVFQRSNWTLLSNKVVRIRPVQAKSSWSLSVDCKQLSTYFCNGTNAGVPQNVFFCFPNAVWASANGAFRIVSDTLVRIVAFLSIYSQF